LIAPAQQLDHQVIGFGRRQLPAHGLENFRSRDALRRPRQTDARRLEKSERSMRAWR
jgi:hypothetical protein